MHKNDIRKLAPIVILAAAFAPLLQAASAADDKKTAALIQTYCQDCHNSTDWSGGLALDVMDLAAIPADAKVWETVVRKLRGRMMPPPTKKQPTQASIDQLVAFVENRIDAHAREHPAPGFISLHRLNRTEYERAVGEILAVKFDASALLPKDVRNEGFDNVANILKVSPSYLDQYLWAAREVSVLAVGDPKTSRPGTTYRPGSEDGRMYVPGMPLGSSGGVMATHVFPVDGEYTFNVGGGGGGFGGGRGGPPGGGGPPAAGGPAGAAAPPGAGGPPGGGGPPGAGGPPGGAGGGAAAATVLLIDGVPVWDSANAPAESRSGRGIKLKVKAGAHKVVVASPARALTEGDEMLKALGPGGGGGGGRGGGGGSALEIVAPASAMTNGILETPSRMKIFICRPTNAADESPCAKRIFGRIAREAFRRPVTDEDLVSPLRFYDNARKTGNFDAGIQQGIMAILASPKFLYRAEQMPANLAPGQSYRITDLDLASRLAFFIWSQGPDDTLLALAESGKLREPANLAAQVKRMLADPRSKSLVTNFAFQWLVIDKADEIMPDQGAFPEFDAGLRTAMKREVELFIDSVLRSEQSVVNLLTASYSFVNERLALHYGLTDIRGNEFRRIVWKDPNRHGLLGKANVLLATSYGDRTSPVVRGAWILENLMGTPPTPPPPGVEALPEGKNPIGRPLTVRERLEVHRKQPSCNACHGIMDPLGLALENFDAIGKWRDVDRASLSPINASERLASGQPVKGPSDLRMALTARPDQFVQTLTEKLMIFALGRTVEYHDMPAVRAIVRAAAKEDYRFESIVLGVVKSDAFQMRQVPLPVPAEGADAVPKTTAQNFVTTVSPAL
jgi:hypothetical protein